jgi:polyvinyl alcohol dehydrogenase (cytochrome)
MNRTVVLSVFALAVLPVLAVQAAETSSVPKVSPVDDPTFSNKASTPPPASPLFQRHCASVIWGRCPGAPHKMFLQMMSPDAIEAAMNQGVMRPQAVSLTADERRLVASYLGGDVGTHAQAPRCTGEAAYFDTRQESATGSWGLAPGNTRFISGEAAGLTAADLPRLELKWALAFPGALRARSQPSVAYGAAYVGSQDGTVYALDLDTGCVRWTYRARAEVRTSIVQEPLASARARNGTPRVYFGDLIAWVYAVDAYTGELVWQHKADDHPNATVTASPAWHDGTLYVAVSSLEVTSAADAAYECCTFRGSVQARRCRGRACSAGRPTPSRIHRAEAAARGREPACWVLRARGLEHADGGCRAWRPMSGPARTTSPRGRQQRRHPRISPPRRCAPLAGSENVGRRMECGLYVPGSPELPEGRRTRRGLRCGRDPAAAARRGPAAHRAEVGPGLRPRSRRAVGREIWASSVGRGGIQGGVHFGMATDGTRLYAPYRHARRPRRQDGTIDRRWLACMQLDVATGGSSWSTPADNLCAGREFCEPGISQAITAIPGAVIAGHMDGRLRAYHAESGRVLWQVDTAREWPTVSGETARGGSFGGGAGPVVADGRLIAVSGYGIYFHRPGNVMLVFGGGAASA